MAEAYEQVKECECQHANTMTGIHNSDDERIDMILNNLVLLNNKTAELVSSIQTAVESGEGVDEWVSEKIAVATSMIGNINDYYAKFKNSAPIGTDLKSAITALGGSSNNMSLGTNTVPITIAI